MFLICSRVWRPGTVPISRPGTMTCTTLGTEDQETLCWHSTCLDRMLRTIIMTLGSWGPTSGHLCQVNIWVTITHLSMLEDSHAGVGCPQVDTNSGLLSSHSNQVFTCSQNVEK